jgi:hypothetical protein
MLGGPFGRNKMKKIFILNFVLMFFCRPCICQSIEYDKIVLIIKAFASGSSDTIGNYIDYPLHRRYPLPAINNKQELIDHFFEIFDMNFINTVAISNPIKDWNEIGWRGIMFNNGEIWLSDNYKIRAINYESDLGKNKWQESVNSQKTKLPLNYQCFDTPIYEWESKNYYYRLDEIQGSYRLLIWNKDQTKLLNVHENGKWEPDGNMGYFHIDWNINNETIRIQNYNRDGEWIYTYLIYDQNELLANEEAKEKYIDIEIK